MGDIFQKISQILDSVSKGCPLLEYIDLTVEVVEYPLLAELIALANLRGLRSVFIHMDFCRHRLQVRPADREDLRVSLYAIVEQGLLEVSVRMTTKRVNNMLLS